MARTKVPTPRPTRMIYGSTLEEWRNPVAPPGYRIAKHIDKFDEGGPICTIFEKINPDPVLHEKNRIAQEDAMWHMCRAAYLNGAR